MSDVRQKVRDHIRAHPGVHFNQLARELDIATGQAQYHLRQLCQRGNLDREEIRGRTHYFPDGYDAWERRVVALLRRETVQGVILYTLENGEASGGELTQELDVARSTISWHVSTLLDADIVEKSYDSKGRTRITLTRPEEIQSLLEDVTPSLSDRLVDRFTRLVDAM